MKIRQYPKSVPYKLQFHYKIKTKSLNYRVGETSPKCGVYYVKLLESCKLQYYQVKGLQFSLIRFCKGRVKVWLFANFTVPLYHKPLMRMGTGKGKLKHWVSNYKKGDILLELEDIFDRDLRDKIFKTIRCKAPARIKILKRLF